MNIILYFSYQCYRWSLIILIFGIVHFGPFRPINRMNQLGERRKKKEKLKNTYLLKHFYGYYFSYYVIQSIIIKKCMCI